LLAPFVYIDVLIVTFVLDSILTIISHVNRVLLESFPHSSFDRPRNTLVLGVHQDVPHRVQLISTVMILCFNCICAFVTVRVCLAVLSLVVERLVHVADVMDQQTQRERLGQVLTTWVQSVLDVVVNVALPVVVSIVSQAQPLDQVLASICHVMLLNLL